MEMDRETNIDKTACVVGQRRDRIERTGLTVLEFLGCVIAVVGGAWLGALYLGVDVRHVAHTALAQAELLDHVPPEWRPPGPQDKTMTREQLVATLREELSVLRNDLTALRAGEVGTPAVGASPAPERAPSTASATVKDKTLAYWLRINEIALGEAALQADAESAADNVNAARVFAIKGRISRFAAKSVEALPSEGVDRAVVQFGRQLGDWYERGGELYERAVRIWESPTASDGREQLNQDWRRAEVQHRNEARLLHDKGVAVRSAASRQFRVEFPEFAKPPAPSQTTDKPVEPASVQQEVKADPANGD
jgi:hypothetical protein